MKNEIAQKIITSLKITANVAKLRAMVLNGYIAKAKGTYAECAECYRRIHVKTKYECEETRGLINLLRDEKFL